MHRRPHIADLAEYNDGIKAVPACLHAHAEDGSEAHDNYLTEYAREVGPGTDRRDDDDAADDDGRGRGSPKTIYTNSRSTASAAVTGIFGSRFNSTFEVPKASF